jgi:hypothetical protein
MKELSKGIPNDKTVRENDVLPEKVEESKSQKVEGYKSQKVDISTKKVESPKKSELPNKKEVHT